MPHGFDFANAKSVFNEKEKSLDFSNPRDSYRIFKMRKFFFLFSFLFLILVSSSCSSKTNLPVKKLTIVNSEGKEISVKAEIASTFEERKNGFMFRQEIPDGTGMLFIFEEEQILDFWMKNTPHPLSIAYIDRKGVIQNIFDMTPYSLATVSSTLSVRYALEVPQGWFEKNGINYYMPRNVKFIGNGIKKAFEILARDIIKYKYHYRKYNPLCIIA